MNVDMTTEDCVKQEAIFAGVNKQSFVADYCAKEQLVAYGASNNVALWNPLSKDNKGVYSTLKKHTKEITGIRFIPNSPYLVSAAEDFEVNVWKRQGNEYAHHSSLQFHQQSITSLSVINEFIFVTGSADGYIALWGVNNESENWGLIHSFQVKSNFYPMTLALQDVDANGGYVLAVGGTNSMVYVYSFTLASDHLSISHFDQSAALTGHEDWIKCLNFVTEEKHKNYILASGSQDRYIRLWRLKLNDQIDDSDEDELKLILLSNKQYKFNVGASTRAAISFDALIMGHDDWVTGLQWHPSYQVGSSEKRLQLLSSSADTALMVWEMDTDSGIWCCVNRLGEMSIKGASTATGASGGFWSCLWFSDDQNQYILANGKTGSLRVYKTVDKEAKTWEAVLGVTGPTREVTDLVWSLNGEYFSTTSLDQTTRIFAPWVKNRNFKTWHEFARPQIHGYDMICLDNASVTKYVSGGDEKLLRVFEMTHSISRLLHNFCGIDIVSSERQEDLPESASLPVLGLSNKAANEQLEAGEMSQQQQDIEENTDANTPKEDILESLISPPLEDHLQRYTLFPELEKLYGHGYEITCCATSPSGSLIASACKSNNARHSVIRIFNAAEEYQQCAQVLEGHNLTVTSLEFSPDGQFLISVSRDRQFSLWKIVGEKADKFELLELNSKAHSRIIWDCSWAPSNPFGNFVVTASRDKQIKLWQVNDKVEAVAAIKLQDAVTSVSCYKSSLLNNKILLAVGLENGDIYLFSVDLNEQEKQFKLHFKFDSTLTPSSRVTKLSFSNKLHDNHKNLMLGVASNDTSVRIYSINKEIFV